VVGLVVMSILAPLAAMLIQMAVSRSREFLADHEGGLMSADPEALAGALAKLEQANRATPMTDARPQTAHMFIVNPLSGQSLASLFSTHPPIPERIARLRELAAQTGSGPWRGPASAPTGPVGPGHAPPPPPPPSSPRGGGRIDWS
jgi:heat shock protein HtpX